MTLLDRYILGQLTAATVIVLAALVALAWFTQVVTLIDIIVEHGRSIFEFLGITMLLMPLIISLITPTAIFVATMVVLDRLNSDSELIIMNASGASRWRLLRPFVFVCVVAVAVVLVFNLFAQPLAMRDFRAKRGAVRADVMTALIDEGQFASPRFGLMVHVKDRTADGRLEGIIFEDSRKRDEPVTYLARRAQLFQQNDSAFLLLDDGSVIRTHADRPTVDLVHFEQYTLNLSEFFKQATESRFSPSEMFLGDLFSDESVESVDPAEVLARRAEAHGRLSTPLYSIVMMLIAFAALCEPQTTRRSRVLSILVSTVIAGMIRVIGFILVNLSAKSAGLIPVVYLFPLICMAGAVFFVGWNGGEWRALHRGYAPAPTRADAAVRS